MNCELIRSRAPLRLGIAGGGTDVAPYSVERGGAVLNTTIDKFAYCTIRPRNNDRMTVNSLDYGLVEEWPLEERPLKYGGNFDLIKAVANHFDVRQGFDMFIHTDAPPGSGLGGSSTVIVSILGAMSEWLGVPMTQYEIAHLAYHLEREELGLRGGKQDQYAAAFGGFNYIEFKREDVIVTPLRVRKDILHELHYSMLLCYTGKTRQSANIIESQMENYRSGQNQEALDAAKRLAEEAKDALLRGQVKHLGEILDQSWEQKKLFSNSISNDVIDKMYALAKEKGAMGGKISGAGGGGYMFFLCEYDRKHLVAKELASHGAVISDFNFEKDGMQTWRYRQ